MNPDKERLLDELWSDESRHSRAAILAAGGAILRRKRRNRIASQVCGFATLVIVAVLLALRVVPSHPSISGQTASPQTNRLASAHEAIVVANNPKVSVVNDAQLLALFPNTPVGLTLVNGRKYLIFPRPEDEQKYVMNIGSDAN